MRTSWRRMAGEYYQCFDAFVTDNCPDEKTQMKSTARASNDAFDLLNDSKPATENFRAVQRRRRLYQAHAQLLRHRPRLSIHPQHPDTPLCSHHQSQGNALRNGGSISRSSSPRNAKSTVYKKLEHVPWVSSVRSGPPTHHHPSLLPPPTPLCA